MKVAEARKCLEDVPSPDSRWKMACLIYQDEADRIIKARGGPSLRTLQGILKELNPWMMAVCYQLLPDDSVSLLIRTEAGFLWRRHNLIDPTVEEYRKQARLEMMRGTPLPLAKAMTEERLRALSSMMLANIRLEVSKMVENPAKEEP